MNLEELADQVLAIDTSHSRDHILLDLEFTKCVETTINRIFDGQVSETLFLIYIFFTTLIHFLQFLQGVRPKGKQKEKQKEKPKPKDTMIILDSDEEEETNR